MRRQQTKNFEPWRLRREQYLRESSRHAELTKEGYAPADPARYWTVITGGRTPSSLERNRGMGLFALRGESRDLARRTEAGSAKDRGDDEGHGVGR